MIARFHFLALLMLIPLLLSAQGGVSFPFIESQTAGSAQTGAAQIGSPIPAARSRSTREKLLNLSGVFHLGYANSRSLSRFEDGPRIETRSPELYWGLDLILRTYILDPRFITLSFEPGFLRGSGKADESETRRGSNGRNFYLEFLPNNIYPFRFYWTKQDNNYTQVPLSSSETGRRSIGFDWSLRKPKLPPLSVSYDSSQLENEFFQVPTSLSRSKTFSLGTHGKLRGWRTNFNYNRSRSTEAFTGLQSGVNLLQGNAGKEIFGRSNLSVSGLYQALQFRNGLTGRRQEFPIVNLRTDLSTQHTKKLRSRLFHQYYRTGSRAVAETVASSGEPGGARISEIRTQASFFNDLGAEIAYQLLPEITVGQTANVNFIHVVNPQLESLIRLVDFAGTIGWHKKIAFLQTRAGYQRGLSDGASNFGNSRAVWFDGYNGGVGLGDKKYLLVNADYSGSRRPDVFQIGARVSQRYLNTNVETQALRLLELRASLGRNDLEYLNLRGRERYRTRTYSVSLIRQPFSIQASRNSTTGLHNLLLSPLVLEPGGLFQTLPIEELLRAPFSATFSVYTSASLGVKLRNGLDAQFRYLRQRVLLPAGPALLLNQYEAFASYRLGKFTFNAGALYNVEGTDNFSERRRGYFFFRMSRHFRIF